MKKRIRTTMKEDIMVCWACALALNFVDAETIDVGPSAEVTDPPGWTAAMARFENAPCGEDWIFGHGESPEQAVAALRESLGTLLREVKLTIDEAMRIFDEGCDWDALVVRFGIEPRSSE